MSGNRVLGEIVVLIKINIYTFKTNLYWVVGERVKDGESGLSFHICVLPLIVLLLMKHFSKCYLEFFMA